MRRSTFLMISVIGLAVTACSSVTSVAPVGDEPVYLEPREWDGLWAEDPLSANASTQGGTASVKVIDAAGGILEYSDPEDKSQTARILVRRHRYGGEEAKFVNVRASEFPANADDNNYLWVKYQRVDNALILWKPVFNEFKRLADKGEVSMTGSGMLMAPLTGEQLDRISIDKEHKLFDYEFNSSDNRSQLLFRISSAPTVGITLCNSQPKRGVGESSEPATKGLPASRFTLTDLGPKTDPGDLAINNAGQVTGLISIQLKDGSWQLIPSPGEDGSGVTEPGPLGGQSIRPAAISNTGQVTGDAQIGPSSDALYHAVLLDPGHGITDLGTLGGGSSRANALNDLGQVVGESDTADGHVHAFLWQRGVMSDLGLPGQRDSSAQGINKSGQVVGSIFSSADHAASPHKAFVWERGRGMTELGTLGGIGSVARSINDKGEVVGASKTVQGYNHAFIWRPGTDMVDLCTLGGMDSAANAINNAAQVVGWSEVTWGDATNHHAVLWEDGKIIDLSSLPEVKAAGWSELTEARGINDQGRIVGIGVRDSKSHVFLLSHAPASDNRSPPGTPTPEQAGEKSSPSAVAPR